ncbi:DUF262 domain-containing protein [Leadbettera azotonutricia]|uniref:GmrSD restriction endonucleases N-terminal domain-containing protein n=1 Tax=Leadbettera azotonutricia (strain ATCC BAA-888 / DSM 13862 / ZAS-9) TaxID=545695 RepID=F5Y7N2_LEAAZ|nr:DUF262 domain-containing protein [Leadbettera azotonutricia]AEF80110.1 conserved hypothetical protein [Leadbettera azotonutricia ZAS-9]
MEERLSLTTIANWQLNNDDSNVMLPSMQRGFVWKYAQIENLWDSLLRKFPIGSFLFSKAGENKNYLMDGQQRATAIALGFYNPFIENMTAWSIKGSLPVIWLDIKPDTTDLGDRKYLFRVTTRSQPWGYRQNSNQNRGILSVADKRSALKIFEQFPDNNGKGYTTFSNKTVFPYDSYYPIPLSFFLDKIFYKQMSNSGDIADAVIEDCRTFLPEYLVTKYNYFSSKEKFIEKLEKNLYETLENICKKLIEIKDTKINYDLVGDEVLLTEDNIEDDSADPTLFVRINSSGTSLSGDDLIYSIYKALFPQTKDLVEKIGRSFIPPTQIINIASRIAMSELEPDRKYHTKLNVKTFQERLKRKGFRNKLTDLIGNDISSPIKQAFDVAIDTLLLTDSVNVPPILVKDFIKSSQTLFLFLIYWIYKNNFIIANENKKPCVAKLMVCSYFSLSGEEETVQGFWEHNSTADFWTKPLNEYFGKTLLPVIAPEMLYDYYANTTVMKHFTDIDYAKENDIWELPRTIKVGMAIVEYYKNISKKFTDEQISNYFSMFINKIFYLKKLVLFAQRDYINKEFSDFNQLDDLEDTDSPWDQDHIYPDSWIYYKQGILDSIREWNTSIGNFRALSLTQNRSENNILSPAARLDDQDDGLKGEYLRQISFVLDNDWEYWKEITNRIKNEKDDQNLYRAISTRMVNIYNEWWNTFSIGKFVRT